MNQLHIQQMIDTLIDLALEEDMAQGDVTTEAIFPDRREAKARIHAKEDGVISGLDVARRVLERVGDCRFSPLVEDGAFVPKGTIVLELEGDYQTLLKAERTMLNFMQRMSGIATLTRRFVQAVGDCQTEILDTRKTLPGFRLLDKLAVRHGGGTNHRMGLYDMVMLKDNHIKAVGSITEAVRMVRTCVPISIKIEVETTNLAEVEEALGAGADIIMLDNMSNEMTAEAVSMIAGRAKVEASGNMSLERVAEVAALGVDYISVGALTHSVKALDLSMNFIDN